MAVSEGTIYRRKDAKERCSYLSSWPRSNERDLSVRFGGPYGILMARGGIGYRDKESKGGTGVMLTSLGRPNIPEERRLCGKVNDSSL